jgi:hypothetical protein
VIIDLENAPVYLRARNYREGLKTVVSGDCELSAGRFKRQRRLNLPAVHSQIRAQLLRLGYAGEGDQIGHGEIPGRRRRQHRRESTRDIQIRGSVAFQDSDESLRDNSSTNRP